MHWKRFCEEIGQIINASAPLYIKMTLFDAITNPMETHINAFCAFNFDSARC
jgi:hypothetical protein